MLYKDFNAGGKQYKLRLSTRNIVTLERNIGCNPLAIFGAGDTIPPLTTMVNVLWCSLQQYHHGISLDDTYRIFDEYLEDNSMIDFIQVIVDIFKVSGLMKDNNNAAEEVNEKN